MNWNSWSQEMPWRGKLVYETLKIQIGNCARKQNNLFWVLFSFSTFVCALYMNVMVVLNEVDLAVDPFFQLPFPWHIFFIFILRLLLARIWLKSKPCDYPYKFSLDILLNSPQLAYLSSWTEILSNIRHHPCRPHGRLNTKDMAGLSCEVCTGAEDIQNQSINPWE